MFKTCLIIFTIQDFITYQNSTADQSIMLYYNDISSSTNDELFDIDSMCPLSIGSTIAFMKIYDAYGRLYFYNKAVGIKRFNCNCGAAGSDDMPVETGAVTMHYTKRITLQLVCTSHRWRMLINYAVGPW